MQEIIKIIIGIVVVMLGFPLGDWLAKLTKEELKQGRIWFKLIIILCVAGAVIALIVENDALLFTFLFMAAVTSRSLKGR